MGRPAEHKVFGAVLFPAYQSLFSLAPYHPKRVSNDGQNSPNASARLFCYTLTSSPTTAPSDCRSSPQVQRVVYNTPARIPQQQSLRRLSTVGGQGSLPPTSILQAERVLPILYLTYPPPVTDPPWLYGGHSSILPQVRTSTRGQRSESVIYHLVSTYCPVRDNLCRPLRRCWTVTSSC